MHFDLANGVKDRSVWTCLKCGTSFDSAAAAGEHVRKVEADERRRRDQFAIMLLIVLAAWVSIVAWEWFHAC